MNLIGRTIANRYEIIEKAGVGGMATVYTAKDIILNRYVAVKVLKEEFTTDEEFVNRFNTEARSAASLSHANIVSIYDVGNEENVYYIVMELVRGKTLKQIITEEGKLPWKWSVNIAIQIASALEVAHKNNIIHRDIKPHNIIITEDGVAKVTDFGIAKAVSNSTITAFGTTIGSVHYFSPEQAKGGYTDAKSDIYSLGVVMYEMLTGKVPFDADTSVSVALKHMQEEPVAPIDINEEIPSAVNDIILKAMEKEPMARYQTATSMIKDLKMALKDPEGEFVEIEELNDGLTRKMDAITDDMLDKNKKSKNKKKKSKLGMLLEKNPKMKVILGFITCILLFVLVFGGTTLVMNLTTPKEVSLPSLTGLTEQEAQSELQKVNLKYSKVNEIYSAQVEAGKIISQEPTYSVGKKVKEKSEVKVIISKGTETTTVPKVIGMTYDEAIAALDKAKLMVEKIEENSKTVEAGIVITQETPADSIANAGDTVKIHVSTGIKQVEVPSLIGQTEESARTALKALNLNVTVEYVSDSTKENGIVTYQSIDEKKSVNEESTITIKVNNYKAPKSLQVVIDIKGITGGYSENSNSVGENSKTVNIKVNNEVRSNISKNDEKYSVELDGKDGETTSVTVTITDPTSGTEIYTSTKNNLTFGTDETVTFKK